jgi:hypothetical protein
MREETKEAWLSLVSLHSSQLSFYIPTHLSTVYCLCVVYSLYWGTVAIA